MITFAHILKALTAMQVITLNEFSDNQQKYFELAEHEAIYVSRENARPILIQVMDETAIPSCEEMEAIQQGLEDIRMGRVTPIKDIHRIWDSIL